MQAEMFCPNGHKWKIEMILDENGDDAFQDPEEDTLCPECDEEFVSFTLENERPIYHYKDGHWWREHPPFPLPGKDRDQSMIDYITEAAKRLNLDKNIFLI